MRHLHHVIGAAARADAGAFLARLVRLDRNALVRLRPVAPGVVRLWAMLPFQVLVERSIVDTELAHDVTVEAQELLRTLERPESEPPRNRDRDWHWSLPASSGHVVETIPEADVWRVATAASRTVRTAMTAGVGGRRVGEWALRDALLDHVPIVVTGEDGERVEVPQRLVQAVVRMGFLSASPKSAKTVTDSDGFITVRRAATWIGLCASYGSAWYRPVLSLKLNRGVDGNAKPFR